MRRAKIRLAILLSALLATLFACRNYLLEYPGKPLLLYIVRRSTGAEMQVAELRFSGLSLQLAGLSIEKQRAYRVSAPEAAVKLSPFSRRPLRVELRAPEITIFESTESSGDSGGSISALPIRLRIRGGSFVYRSNFRDYSLSQIDCKITASSALAADCGGNLRIGVGESLPVTFDLDLEENLRISLWTLDLHGRDVLATSGPIRKSAAPALLESSKEHPLHVTANFMVSDLGEISELIAALSFLPPRPELKEYLVSGGLHVDLSASAAFDKLLMKVEAGGLETPRWQCESGKFEGAVDLHTGIIAGDAMSCGKSSYASGDGLYAVSAGRFDLDGAFTIDPARKGVGGRGELRANLEGYTVGSYHDRIDRALTLDFSGAGNLHGSILEVQDLRLREQGGPLDLKLDSSAASLSLQAQGNLAGAWAARLALALAGRPDQIVHLKGFEQLGGTFKYSRRGADRRLEARIAGDRLELANFPGGGTLTVTGFDIPLRISSGTEASGASARGRLSLEGRLAGQTLPRQNITLRSSENLIELDQGLSAPAGFANLAVDGIRIAFRNFAPEIGASLAIQGLDLPKLQAAVPVLRNVDSITIDPLSISYNNRELGAAGELRAELFGGHAVVHSMRMLTGLPDGSLKYGADLEFGDLNLQRLTGSLSFGEIRGTIGGEIKNLEIVDGLPVKFDASIKTSGVGEQSISVKALDNLSTISQGGGLEQILSQGIYQFIDYYRYQKIGMHAILSDDRFTLQGTARKNDARYLVYGGRMPPRIDVIAPENTISFNELLKRLSRIYTVSPETEAAGP